MAHLGLAFLLLAPAACGPKSSEKSGAQESTGHGEEAAQAGQVERIEAPRLSPTPSAAPVASIATNPGSEGSQFALNRVSVTGDIMTVQLGVTGDGGSLSFKIAAVSAVDDASAKRLAVLRDDDGRWMAAPVDNGGNMSVYSLSARPDVIWMKFPAPPPTSRTVSINIPEVAPFDGVPIQR